jgi:YegS/Rv2252/BmrU family lipid kinase
MPDQFKTKLVVNPRSANGRTGKNWAAIEARIREHLPEFDTAFTQGPMHATELARDALRQGYEMVVTVGGDGTNSEVVNGFFEPDGAPVRPDAVLGVLPMGTGCDFVKTAGIPKPVEQAAVHLPGRHAIPCDAGYLEYTDSGGNPAARHFINITDFGIGGEVAVNVNRTTKALGGFVSFFGGILRTELTYRNKTVRLYADGRDLGERLIKNVIVANGQFFGGGMRIAREAALSDGQFEVIIMNALTRWEGLRLIRGMYSGDYVDYTRKIERFKARELRAESTDTVLLDVDGEQPGRLPCSLKIVPRAIRLKLKDPESGAPA